MVPTDNGGVELSAFGAEKFTTRSREVVEAAQLAATAGGNTHTEPIHLLVALLKQEDGSTRSLVQKAGVDPATLLAQAERVQQLAVGREHQGRHRQRVEERAQQLEFGDRQGQVGLARGRDPAGIEHLRSTLMGFARLGVSCTIDGSIAVVM